MVSRMLLEHIAILTDADGYTVRRYEGYVRNHFNGNPGDRGAAEVEYRDIMLWVRMMKDKGLKPKTIANVHGLLSGAFNTMVREKKRANNPCKGVALPKDDSTEEKATFLALAEWEACTD